MQVLVQLSRSKQGPKPMTKPPHPARFVLPILMILAFGISAMTQSNKGAIVGTVKDPNDALVANTKITVTNVKTGEVRGAESGDEGTYTVTNLEPGMYKAFSSFGSAYINAFPLPNLPGAGRNYSTNRKEHAVVDSYDIRIDHRLNSNNNFFARYSKSQTARAPAKDA